MTQQKTKLYGLILAGGFSKRMGQDKALLDFHGKPQIEYVHALLGKLCAKVYLSKRSNQKPYKRLLTINDAPEFADIGPIGGILSAMKTHPGVSWVVVACDLPFIDGKTIKALIANRNVQSFATAFISTHDGLPEPLCAIWEGESYKAMVQLLEQGIQCPRKMLIKSKTHLIPQENPRWLDNVNTPQELEQTRQQLNTSKIS